MKGECKIEKNSVKNHKEEFELAYDMRNCVDSLNSLEEESNL